MASVEAFIAANRLGLGAKPGELDKISEGPKQWARAQLDARFAKNEHLDAVSRTYKLSDEVVRFSGRTPDKSPETEARMKDMQQASLDALYKRYVDDVSRQIHAQAESEAPFFERLVQFWSNHFTISCVKWGTMSIAVAHERDDIRPYIMGDFESLLVSAVRNPAMLIYLDNIESFGPKSQTAAGTNMGLNENLAREIMELHTLGVDGGYTQDDVREFSKMLTGWNVQGEPLPEGWGWKCVYFPEHHEPGEKKLLGKIYRENGRDELAEALHDLAHHPSTAGFIARKLARHFIADDPDEADVQKLARAFTDGKGQLVPVYEALLELDALWKQPLPKLKTPIEFILSVLRASGMDPEDKEVTNAARDMSQMPFTATSPAGWSDRARDWLSAESLLQRINFARLASDVTAAGADPLQLMAETVGPVLTDKTKHAVMAAGSASDAMTILFSSPEFQRR